MVLAEAQSDDLYALQKCFTVLCTLQFVYTAYFHLLRSLDHQVNQVSIKVYTCDILPEFIEGLRQEVSTPLS